MSISRAAARAARFRPLLLTSAGMMSLVLGGTAHAQALDKPSNAYLEAQKGGATAFGPVADAPSNTWLEAQSSGSARIDAVAPEPQILIANPNTPTDARDPYLINGISQMVVDEGDGFIGLCTATLINPRTVIFAAHCVNEQAANSYGANSGGTAIGFGFENNTRANAPGQTDELVRWLFGDATGAGKYQTNLAQSFFNANFVAYNPYSLEPDAQSFLYGDVALATLDTPAAKIPTWALMFSPLTNTGTIGAAGTGFNVNIAGYGNNGTGQAGAAGIDFRRRAAENILGALTDLDTFETFLFGEPNGLTQNLYFLDFDDPRRGMNTASPFDFNAFRDNAVASGKEGITSSGDSGGPLILTNFSKQVVLGVLSGGYTRFFNGQPANGYGTVSFYQPLYLYWDWIAANNPYHYVTATAGNGSWTDPTHWATTLDPAYTILAGGQLVNGIPTTPGEQKFGTTGDFGQICFQSSGNSDCYDTRTGTETVENKPIGTAATTNTTTGAKPSGTAGFDGVTREAQATTTVALPTPTLTNGLPGATNFVPNNVAPVRATSTAGRYFDVTLAATGITTLTGANVTIDRLTLGTSGAQLVIDSGATLNTLINTTQFAGFVTVNGTLNSTGDYSLMAGGLLGTGRINAPFVNSILGQIAPGTTSTIGTLTIGGNLLLSSGNTYLVNLGANAASDKLAVVATAFTGTGTARTPTDGLANIGGLVNFSSIGTGARAGTVYTILTADNRVTGTFAAPTALSAILTPRFIYSNNAVQVTLDVSATYTQVIGTGGTPVQLAYAGLLDRNRANQGRLGDVFGPLDLQNAATIGATLESLAPRAETLNNALGTVTLDNLSRFYRDRLTQLEPGQLGGTLALIGQPLQLAALSGLPGQAQVRTDAGDTVMQEGKLPDTVSGFIAGGYIDGDSRPMATAVPGGGRDQFDGFYVAAGLEKELGDNALGGLSFSYTQVDGTTAYNGQKAKSNLFAATLYGKANAGNLVIDAVATAGSYDATTDRTVNFVGTTYNLHANDQSLALSGEVGVGGSFGTGSLKFGPRVALRGSRIKFGGVSETGGGPALTFDRDDLDSLQARAGATIKATGRFRPYVTGYYVHEFADKPYFVGANFVGGTGANALFTLAGTDKDWAEVGGGLTYAAGFADISIGADTTIERKDVKNQSYRASLKLHF